MANVASGVQQCMLTALSILKMFKKLNALPEKMSLFEVQAKEKPYLVQQKSPDVICGEADV